MKEKSVGCSPYSILKLFLKILILILLVLYLECISGDSLIQVW